MIYTTYRLAKEAGACELEKKVRAFSRYKYKGGVRKWGEDYLIPLTDVLEVCGIDDTLWAMVYSCTEPDKAKWISRIFRCNCAEHILPIFEQEYPDDNRPRRCIEITRKHIDGQATDEELAAARDAARAATWAATWAAARDAARAATWASAATSAATWAATWDVGREWQKNRLRELLEG